MKPDKLRIAIYSGVIPTTTFIEHLIGSLAAYPVEILLFGTLRSVPEYTGGHVKVYATCQSGFAKRIQLILRLIRLFFKDFKAFRYVVAGFRRSGSIDQLARYVPVLLHKPDIFHIQWAKSVPDWMFLKEEFGIPVVVSLRGAHINYSPLADQSLADAYRRTFPKLDGAHAVSEDLAGKGEKYGMTAGKIRVIRTGVPLDISIDRTPIIEKFNEPLKLLSVGRFHWKKGYDIALDALDRLHHNNTPFRYTLVAGSENEELLFQLKDLNLEQFVEFKDKISQTEVLECMDQADILLLPSVEEGIANVAVEAMARGTLVLSSDCGGMPELITDGETGFLFRAYHPEDLAAKVVEITRLPVAEINRIRANALEHVKTHFTLERLGSEMYQWYRELIAG